MRPMRSCTAQSTAALGEWWKGMAFSILWTMRSLSKGLQSATAGTRYSSSIWYALFKVSPVGNERSGAPPQPETPSQVILTTMSSECVAVRVALL